jgi:hypothetical protein
MNRFLYLLMALLAGALAVRAQQPAAHNHRNNYPLVDGGVESVGGRFRVSLTNTDSTRGFRGVARVSIGAPDQQSEVARFEFTLAPQESRVFPLDSPGAAGDHYTLSIHERAGALILLKNAPINRNADAELAVVTPPGPTPPASTAQTVPKGLTVTARLAAGRHNQSTSAEIKTPAADQPSRPQGREINLVMVAPPISATGAPPPEQPGEPQVAANKKPSPKFARRGKSSEVKPIVAERPNPQPTGEIEAPIYDDPTSVVLAFEITAPTPLINASLSVKANEFKERQAITIQGTGSAEFKLPDDFNESKINYTLTDASGKTLIAGEFDFEALRMEDSVHVSEAKFDQETYTPGQSASLVMTLEGRSQYGYLLEVTAKDVNGALLLNDSRRGTYHNGKSIQEFHIEIPAEAQGVVAVEFKALGNLTKKLFDSGSRNIIINNTQ